MGRDMFTGAWKRTILKLKVIVMLAFRNLNRRRLRTLLIFLSLIITVVSFILILSVAQYIGLEITTSFAERTLFVGEEAGYPYFCDVMLIPHHPWWSLERTSSLLISDSILIKVKDIHGIEWIEPYLGDVKISFNQGGQYKNWYVEHRNGTVEEHSSDLFLAGVDPLVEPKRMTGRMVVVEGKIDFNSEGCAIVGYNFAKSNNISIGDVIIVPTDNFGAEHNTPGSFSKSSPSSLWVMFYNYFDNPWQEHFTFSLKEEIKVQVVGIFYTSTPYDNFIVTDYKQLQKAYGFGEKVTVMLIKLKSTNSSKDVLNNLWSLEDVEVVVPITKKRYVWGVGVGSTFSGISSTKYINFYNIQYALIMIFATSAFIFTIVYTNVRERRWEIGLLKAIGFRPTFVLFVILTEMLIIGLFAGILGFFLASILLSFLKSFYPNVMPLIGEKATFGWGLTIIFLSIFITMLSSFIPAFQAARVKPMDAMRGR